MGFFPVTPVSFSLARPRMFGQGRGRGGIGTMSGEGPGDMLAHERGRVLGARLQGRDDRRIARGVAEGHGEVAQPALISGAPDGGTFGALEKLLLRPGEELNKRRRVESVARCEIRLARRLREPVPRADKLAVVAAEDAIADERAQLLGDRPAQLNGEVGNAAARVEIVRRDDRAGRTDIHAGAAGAAVIFDRYLDRQRQVGIYLAQKKPRTRAAVDQTGVFADPAEARLRGEWLFQHRGAVAEDAVAVRADLRLDPLGEPLQPVSDELRSEERRVG